ncbi:hypothetical protein F5Y18DRAFT_384318 [Xylariaceae sp. FL1019]|nr:hypothetical protein F5Y18DRAFT_384318 [Xylariaceae sp. FL1019]
MAPNLQVLVGQYPILESLASYLSAIDLLNLGLVNQHSRALILSSPAFFDHMKRNCLCDGRGLRDRIKAVTELKRGQPYIWGPIGGNIHHDEEIEVRLFARKCDEAGALPCIKCGLNICEECRVCPRALGDKYKLNPRPHVEGSFCKDNVMALCDKCDAEMEANLKGSFLNELCDCNRYRRWICARCVWEEKEETSAYYQEHTISETHDWETFEEMYDATKRVNDHQFELLFFCTCGSVVPQDQIMRCTWCKRRHRPEGEWHAEHQESENNIPGYVDDDGCYPQYSPRLYERDMTWDGYPALRYNGPIYQAPVNDDGGPRTTLPLRSSDRRHGPVSLRAWQMGFH